MLLHDIGKGGYLYSRCGGTGPFYGHPDRGAAMCPGEIVRACGCGKKDRENIVTLMRWHDQKHPRNRTGDRSRLADAGRGEFPAASGGVKRADNLAQAPEFHYVGSMLDEAEALLRDMLRKKRCLQIRDRPWMENDLLALGYSGREIGQARTPFCSGSAPEKWQTNGQPLLAALQERGPLLP